MVSPEEKRKFIERMAEQTLQKVQPLKLCRQAHDLLLRDTDNGKLYKYRTFDEKGYSLKNLREGTLHCSSANVFNDPFDCKLGVSFQELYASMQNIELDKIDELLDVYLQVMRHEKDIETCSLEEQGVIKKLLNSNLINDFINNTSKKAETQEEMAILLKDNAEVIVELLQIVCFDVNFKDAFQISIKMIPQMMARSSTEGVVALSNTNVSVDGFARANGVLEDLDEWGLIVRLSQKLFPEHFVAVADVQRQLEETERNLVSRMNSAFLVGCLCTSYKNRLMWSHYAEKHQGFCIEYDFSGTDEETLLKIPAPVIYSKKRPQVPWKAAIDNSTPNLKEAYKDILIGLLTKDEIWAYENEWRIFVNAAENSELAMPLVSCIYLGAAIENKNRAIVLEIAREHNIPVKQMKVDRGTYELHAEEIENV